MSVTFWMSQAPQVRVQPYPEDEPDYFTTEPAAPFSEINLANDNAYAIVSLLDPTSVHYYEDGSKDVFGEWDMSKLNLIHKRVMATLNLDSKKERLYVDPFISQEPGQMRVYAGGRDQDYVNRLLTRLLDMITVAREHQFPITFG